MRRFAPIVTLAAAATLAASAAFAEGEDGREEEAGVAAQTAKGASAVILSTEVGAMAVPEMWDCDLYAEEYRTWLEDGNDADDWRFAGNTYRAANDGDLYVWQDWLDFAEDQGCPPIVVMGPQGPMNGLFADGMTGIGIVSGALGTGLIAASGGENAKSPG